jgi:hypothetical protein
MAAPAQGGAHDDPTGLVGRIELGHPDLTLTDPALLECVIGERHQHS